MTKKEYRIETKAIQAGYDPKTGESRIPPISQSTTFVYEKADDMAALFDLEASGFFYTRLGNPTTDAYQKKMAELEGGIAAIATASGQSASLYSVANIAQSGDNIIALNNIYGGTFTLLKASLARFGIETRFVEIGELDKIHDLVDENTKCVFGESLSNPSVQVLDIEKVADIAHQHGLPLIIDNTFPTPYLCRPFEHGADIIVHSSTKYLDGHAAAMGGIVIDSGKFDWTNGRFPLLTEPDPNYHGVSYTESFKEAAYITRATAVLSRDLGAIISPMNAFLTSRGVETLHLRMERHSENALKVAKFLEGHEKVESVNYPGLKSDQYYELAKKYLPKGQSGVVSVRVKGGKEEGKKFMEALNLFRIVTHVADTRSCVLHPASATHRQLDDATLIASGIYPNSVRLSIGIENIDDIIEDIDQALSQI
ncbi:MAG: O-acetylhomoserine aminocarboxypropyltransferase/cysteine synthase [Erysipelotrichaceae bacterium]|nr:O-acetylhomoserine aminocarboxypropyltransferase/cysteine synthase [Erysipelotrichaceae bacterium]